MTNETAPAVAPTAVNANRVTTSLPGLITDTSQSYDGFECSQAPPLDSLSDSSAPENNPDTIQLSESIHVSKINDSTTTTS